MRITNLCEQSKDQRHRVTIQDVRSNNIRVRVMRSASPLTRTASGLMRTNSPKKCTCPWTARRTRRRDARELPTEAHVLLAFSNRFEQLINERDVRKSFPAARHDLVRLRSFADYQATNAMALHKPIHSLQSARGRIVHPYCSLAERLRRAHEEGP